ncbi:hypothetical protein ACFWXO_09490 [Kitasatospora sp. NPDC059088]|uniref:hypothetical protein n=1 Tax=Kitasatospora sp. NPDC059088 TaxID=3346722 RepID=UPI0036C8FE17
MVERSNGPAAPAVSSAVPAAPTEVPVPPTDREVRWVYQPVEVDLGGGHWAPGRISGWWQDPAGRNWCRLRVGRSGLPADWRPFEPDRVRLLPVSGL